MATTKSTTRSTSRTSKSASSKAKTVAEDALMMDGDSSRIKVEPVANTEKEERVFKNDDLISCKSVTSGELLVIGPKTGILYRFADCDYYEDIQYQDLLYLTRSRSAYVFSPTFIVMDEDFVEQNKQLNDMYSSLYSITEVNEILNLPVSAMKATIESLPKGIQNAVKGVAATNIESGLFDSVKKIKVLDEIFGTLMLQMLVEG